MLHFDVCHLLYHRLGRNSIPILAFRVRWPAAGDSQSAGEYSGSEKEANSPVGRRSGVTGQMLLDDDDRRRVVPDGVAEQLGHADDLDLEAAERGSFCQNRKDRL